MYEYKGFAESEDVIEYLNSEEGSIYDLVGIWGTPGMPSIHTILKKISND